MPAKKAPVANASALSWAASMPTEREATSSSRTDRMARPNDECTRLRITTITKTSTAKPHVQFVQVGIPTMPRAPFIVGIT